MLKPAMIIGTALLGASLAVAAPAQALDLPAGSSAGGFNPAAMLPAPVAGFLPMAPARPAPAPVDPAARRAGYVDSVNWYRANAGLAPVTESADLDAQAQEWADHLAATGTFEHSTVSCNDQGLCLSENIATAGVGAAAGDTVARWFDSPSHRENLLRGNAVQVGHGEAISTGGEFAGHLIVVERFYSQY